MIRYIEKGPGLHAAISKAGHFLGEENGVFVSDAPEAVQAIIDAYSLADAKAYKANEVNQLAKSLRDKAVRSISTGEMASWSIKMAEAASYSTTGLDEDAPMLAAEARVRGVLTSSIVARVEGNASAFAALEAAISGNDGKHRDAIKKLSTFEEITGYDYSAGWPGV